MRREQSSISNHQISEIPKGSSLVFAPHPDDETFGLAGSILRLTQKSEIVNCIIMTNGSLGADSNIRENETALACKNLSISNYHFLNFPDQNLQLTANTIEQVVNLIKSYNPHNIFFPSPLELHGDHRTTAWIVWNAMQHLKFKGEVYSYEVANQSIANTFIDITETMQKKIETMQLYNSQIEQYDYISFIKSINRSRAYTLPKNIEYVEALFHFDTISSDLMSYYYEYTHRYHQKYDSLSLPLVSILIRTKDRPTLLKKALHSIQQQSYKKFEVNIINDGGVQVEEIVHSYNFENFSIHNNKRSQGRAKTANSLLEMIQGDYAIFLDDDDTIDHNHINNLIKILIENPNILVCYSSVRVGEGLENSQIYDQSYDEALLRYRNYIPIHSALFSKKLIEKGCHFDTSFEIYEDWDFWLQLSQHTPFYHIPQITATYNINGDSGAGESKNSRDREAWKLKIYKKWMSIWTEKQLQETFKRLKNTKIKKIQDLEQQQKKLFEELIIEKNKISILESKNNKLQTNRTHSDGLIDLLVKERIQSNDEYHLSKNRSFTLASTRGNETECRELYEDVFEKPMSVEFWNWKYYGSSWRGVCAKQNNKIIAHYNGMVRDILYLGKRTKALQACDIMVHPEARGGFKKNSPFYATAKAWIKSNLGADKDFFLSYGFPNRRSMLLGQKISLYQEVDTITHIQWKLQKNINIEKNSIQKYTLKSKINPQINQLWRDMAIEFKEQIIGVRDANYLKRRYLTHPAHKYTIYLVYNDEDDLCASFVIRQTKHRIMLMDLIAPKRYFETVIAEASSIAYDRGYEYLSCWITTSQSHLFDYYQVIMEKTDICIPTSNITENFDPKSIKDKWFLMYGDSDFN